MERKKNKIVVIDGQGGRLGCLVTEKIKASDKLKDSEVFALGTNSTATSAMLKSGADCGATGENPVVVNSRDADFIVGPVGIVCADSLLGEVTDKMALAVGKSRARKILIPVNKCSIHVAGASDMSLSLLAEEAVNLIASLSSDA